MAGTVERVERPHPLTEIAQNEPFNTLVSSLRQRISRGILLLPSSPETNTTQYIPNTLLMTTIESRIPQVSGADFLIASRTIDYITKDWISYEKPVETDYFRGLIGIHSALGRRQGFMDAFAGEEPQQTHPQNAQEFTDLSTSIQRQAREYAEMLRYGAFFKERVTIAEASAEDNLSELRRRVPTELSPGKFEEATRVMRSITTTLSETNMPIRPEYFGELARLHFAIDRRQGYSDVTIYGRTPSSPR